MKKYGLIHVYIAIVFVLITVACSNPVKNKLQGNWRSKDGTIKLAVTSKSFTLEDGEAVPEDYFIKGDTVFTSFQGNLPYTLFIVQKLSDHYLKLMGPDSVAMEYIR